MKPSRALSTWLAGASLALLVAMLFGVVAGPAWLRPSELLDVAHGTAEPWLRAVVVDVRLPRVLVAAMVGASLAASGAALQAIFRSSLADPGVLGLTSGASLGAVSALALGLATTSASAVPVGAALGTGLAATLLVTVSRRSSEHVLSLLVLGVALASLLGALVSLVLSLSLADYVVAQSIVHWLLGGLEARSWDHVQGGLVPLAIGLAWIGARASALDALQLGELSAAVVGVDTRRVSTELLVALALVVGTSVALAGSIGFVGLLVPHAARLAVGARHARLLPVAALLGAVLVVTADLVGRIVLPLGEVPVGVVTALLGAPALFVLAARKAAA